MRKHIFKTLHPLVNLLYFLSVIGFSCLWMHPLCLGISLVCGVSYGGLLKGWEQTGKTLGYLLPLAAVMALMNPLFNHQGVTVLWYFPSGNPLTLESVLYGVLAAGMIACVIFWFTCWQQVMTDDKITYLFGRIVPSLSLIFSMTLRFVPRFLAQFQKVAHARRGAGQGGDGGKLSHRLKNAFAILSGVTTWALENAMDTADSMKARGYGLPGRTAFALYRFDRGSALTLGALLALAGVVIAGGVLGQLEFRCFPALEGAGVTLTNLPFFLAYFLLCSIPLFLELWEVRRWNSTKSKT